MRITNGVVVKNGVIRFHHAEDCDIAIGQVGAHTLDDKLNLGIVGIVGVERDARFGAAVGIHATRNERASPGKLLGGRVVVVDCPGGVGALHHLDIATGGSDILPAARLGIRLQLEQAPGPVAARCL